MAHSWTWDNTTPTGSNVIREGDDRIRELKLGVDQRMSLEHAWGDSTTYDGMFTPASNFSKTAGAVAAIEHILGVVGGNTITVNPTTAPANKPYLIFKSNAAAAPVTITLNSGNWNNVGEAGTSFKTSVTLHKRGDYIWFIKDGTDAYILGIRRDGVRTISNSTETLDEFDDIVILNGNTSAATAVLPAANIMEGKIYKFVANNVSKTCKISGTINGTVNYIFSGQYDTNQVGSNGTNWFGFGRFLVATADIEALQVTGAKIAAEAIDYPKIVDNAVPLWIDGSDTEHITLSTSYVQRYKGKFYKTNGLDSLIIHAGMKQQTSGQASYVRLTISGSVSVNTGERLSHNGDSYAYKQVSLDISSLATGWCYFYIYQKSSSISHGAYAKNYAIACQG